MVAKLERKRQKIFGATGDAAQFGQIGSDAAGTPATSKDPDVIQSLAQYLAGLFSITNDLNAPPRGQDLNALYHLITRQLAYLFEAGVPEWEAATEYSSLTSLVLHGGNVWLSLSNSNIGNTPALGSVHWRKVIDQYGTARESVSTSSRIFDLTGDRVPAIPDDPAGVTYQNIQNFTTADGWTANNCTLSYSGGKMIITATNALFSISRTVTASRLVIMKIRKVSSSGTGSKIGNTSGTEYLYIKPYGNNPEHIHSVYIGSGATGAIVLTPAASGGAIGDVFEISFIYIGTGAYLSKLVDRAGVPWTNYGALPVDGPFGKSLQFNDAQYLEAPGPMIGTTGTIAIKFKRGAVGTGVSQILFSNANTAAISGIACFFNADNTLIIRLRNGSAVEDLLSVTITDTTEIHDFSFTIDGINAQVTFDGIKYSKTLSAPVSVASLNNMFVGSSLGVNEFFTGTIYALRADSRVWTDEEIARWSRDPYSEESIPASSTPVANALMQWSSSGNFSFPYSATGRGVYVYNTSTGHGVSVDNISTGVGVSVYNSGTGRGVYVHNSGTGVGVSVYNTSTGHGVSVDNTNTGYGVYVGNAGNGQGVYVSNAGNGDGVRVSNAGYGRGVYVSNAGNGYGLQIVQTTGTGKTAIFSGRPIVLPVKTGSTTGGMGESVEEGCFHVAWSGTSYRLCTYVNGAWRYATLS